MLAKENQEVTYYRKINPRNNNQNTTLDSVKSALSRRIRHTKILVSDKRESKNVFYLMSESSTWRFWNSCAISTAKFL
jgi:hypothetical protein